MTSSPSASPKRVAFYASALHAFTTSSSTFRVLHSIPSKSKSKYANASTSPLPPPKNLYILDSSFNPPTLAHLHIARSALLEDAHQDTRGGTKRLLLLLATQNADKSPKPAAFAQRLAMMEIFAQELLASLDSQSDLPANACEPPSERSREREGGEDEETERRQGKGEAVGEIQGIDIALTTHPYFVQKSTAISSHPSFPTPDTTQIHLTGYDTLIRILDPKYYPPEHTLHSLHPFLDKHRLRVSYRADDSWGSREEQDRYLKAIGEGAREREGARREWIREGRLQLVEGQAGGQEAVSSTKVREAVRMGDSAGLGQLVSKRVGEWVLGEGLYLDD